MEINLVATKIRITFVQTKQLYYVRAKQQSSRDSYKDKS